MKFVTEGVEWDVGDQKQVVNSVPPSDRQIDREGQSGTRTVFENVHRP